MLAAAVGLEAIPPFLVGGALGLGLLHEAAARADRLGSVRAHVPGTLDRV